MNFSQYVSALNAVVSRIMIILLKDYNNKKVRTQQVEPSEDQVRSVQYARALFEV